jgi:hypothetical protein
VSVLSSPPAADGIAQRAVAIDCLTDAGWVAGRFHIPATQSFTDFLLQGGAFLPLTDAAVPGRAAALPFFALQRDDLRLVAPDPADALIATRGGARFTSPWSVTCLMRDGVVEGEIDFLTNQRLSDYLRAAKGFILLREATWQPLAPAHESAAPGAERRFSILLVNIARLVGIAEAEQQRGHGHPGKLSPSDTELG